MFQVGRLPRWLALSAVSLAALCSSCFTSKQEARITALEVNQARMAQATEELSHTLSTLIIDLENERRRASREKYCKEPKIIEFMDEVEAGLQSACTPIAMTTTLNFLDKIPTACAHLDPNEGAHNLLHTRVGQIRKNLEPDNIHPSTRILVMAKPAEDTADGRALAKELATKVIEDIVKKALPPPPAAPPAKEGSARPHEIPILGPYLLPCELSHNMGLLYKKPYYRPIEGEPKIGKPDVAVFVVVSPC
jgi:hypothetical protein